MRSAAPKAATAPAPSGPGGDADPATRGLAGARGVRWALALLAPVILGLILWQLLIPRPYLTGTDSVGVYAPVAGARAHERLCVADLEIPAGTGIVRLAGYSFAPRPEALVSVTAAGRTTSSRVSAPTSAARAYRADLEVAIPTRPASPASVPGRLCMVPLNSEIQLGGVSGIPAGQHPTVSVGRGSFASEVAVWYEPPRGQERSLLSQLGAIFARAALFRPGIVGSWSYPVLLFALLPLSWLLALALLARAAAGAPLRIRGRRVRAGLAIALIAFVNAGSWALITPAFDAPDEPSHFAYVQYLAETGHMPAKAANAQPAYSTDQALALGATDIYSIVADGEARPPWLAADQLRWERASARLAHPAAGDGGGFTVAASVHDPPYYALAAIPYLAVSSQSVFSQITVMRLVSALLGALAAFCAFGVVRELFPRQRVAAVAAGLLVAFQPMFGFISGAVNNDSGINGAAALALYLLVRALRRGLSWRLALALGATLAIAPLMKETGYEIYPVAVLGLACVLWRARERLRAGPWATQARPWAALIAGFGAVVVGWQLLKPALLDTYGNHAGAAGGISATSSISLALHQPGRFLEYLWELFLPPLQFMTRTFPSGWPFYHVYIERGWGSFGWYLYQFPNAVYLVIVIAMGVVALLALWAAVRARGALRGRVPEVAVILLFPVCVLVAVEAAYFTPTDTRTAFAEQGRYIFPAIAALAVIAVGGTFGAGRRLHVPLATGLVVAMIGLSYASQWLALASFFT